MPRVCSLRGSYEFKVLRGARSIALAYLSNSFLNRCLCTLTRIIKTQVQSRLCFSYETLLPGDLDLGKDDNQVRLYPSIAHAKWLHIV